MDIGTCNACGVNAGIDVIAAAIAGIPVVDGIDGMGVSVDGIVGIGVILDGIVVIGGIICIVGLIAIEAAQGTAGGGNGGCVNFPSMPLP